MRKPPDLSGPARPSRESRHADPQTLADLQARAHRSVGAESSTHGFERSQDAHLDAPHGAAFVPQAARDHGGARQVHDDLVNRGDEQPAHHGPSQRTRATWPSAVSSISAGSGTGLPGVTRKR